MQILVLFCSLFWFVAPAYADIFKCIKTDSAVYYQARPCNDPQDLQTLISYKKELADKNRRLRFKAKCEKVTQQIKEVTQHYRTGYTVKQGKALDRKLNEYKDKRLRYCKHE